MPTVLPVDYAVRAALMDDVEAVVDLVNACFGEQTGKARLVPNELRINWQAPGFNLETDTRIVTTLEGKIVGVATIRDNDPHVHLTAEADVHPDHRGRGIGTALCHWIDTRARQVIPEALQGARVVLAQERLCTDRTAHLLLQGQGYVPARHSYHMVIHMHEPPPAPAVPPGITLRPFIRGQEERAVVQTMVEAFEGHYGFVPRPFEEEYEYWMHYFDTDPGADPSLWFVAVDGSEIVGTVLCHPEAAEDPEMAWIFALGVRKPWRRQGLGLALLRNALAELYRHGRPKACLGVDAENPTGATHLYEKAGMSVQHEFIQFEKELRPPT
jgi:mycothiol synthase